MVGVELMLVEVLVFGRIVRIVYMCMVCWCKLLVIMCMVCGLICEVGMDIMVGW